MQAANDEIGGRPVRVRDEADVVPALSQFVQQPERRPLFDGHPHVRVEVLEALDQRQEVERESARNADIELRGAAVRTKQRLGGAGRPVDLLGVRHQRLTRIGEVDHPPPHAERA